MQLRLLNSSYKRQGLAGLDGNIAQTLGNTCLQNTFENLASIIFIISLMWSTKNSRIMEDVVALSITRQTLSMTARRVRFRCSDSFLKTSKQASNAFLACNRLRLKKNNRILSAFQCKRCLGNWNYITMRKMQHTQSASLRI